jgi:alpha-tubulin suppressor-like RCC1 family protein
MKIDTTKLGYRWKGTYAAGAVYAKGDVVRKEGQAQVFDGLYWTRMTADQQNAVQAGELATFGEASLLKGAMDQQLYVNSAGDDLEFRYGEGRTSSACVDLADIDNGCGNGQSNGGETAAALMSDGTVCMWGHGSHGNMGDGNPYNRSKPIRAGFPPNTPPIVKIARGYYNTFAIDADGKLWAWGYNNFGQLGTDTGTSNVTIPTLVSGKGDLPLDAKVVQVKGGSGYNGANATLIRTEDGRVYHAGWQAYGSAGTLDAQGTNHSAPKLVQRSVNTKIVDMFVWGITHSATWLIDENGQLWGAGEQGSIGRINNNANNVVMHQLWNPSTYDPVVKLIYEESDDHAVAGNQHYRQFMIITRGGRIWSWGEGQVQSGTNYISDPAGGFENFVPKLDSRIDNVVDGYTSSGRYHSAMVLKADGTVWAIGNDQDSLFSPNAQSYVWVPVYADYLTNVVKLFPGGARHGKSCGYLTADGKWYMSGMNNYGQSGNGVTTNGWTAPVLGHARLPAPITKVTYIGTTNDSANYQTIYAMCGDGNLYSWGYNASGQLGWDDDNEYSCVPSPVLF